ncbi:hypothetical protein SPBR_08259 [Sporothrix brasiliensis 5110]|uniref:Uncharacterized protein n=1 Tax=Sporothrix brasiliensis 5110 TaxID=1398154 RepID=A0A0C2IB55_9PEZI|nr:uncharacterized protein SPBR_08259 [Sporothrix brasiliensis 5110]KIH86481.1 hypothetical protein SPBR_08259 [Sporothrix brasiliensis 5110]
MMNGSSQATIQAQAIPRPRKRASPEELHRRRLQRAIAYRGGSGERIGRAGQWILHNFDIYISSLDTRPHSRHPDKVVPVRGLTYNGIPINDQGLIWAGEGPVPGFQDVAFWEGKHKELEEKMDDVDNRRVQPRFTPEELRVLESLEQQEGHSFRAIKIERTLRAEQSHNAVFNCLFEFGGHGRPGQWILHNEDLYHPVIDTRPQTRKPGKSIVIHDSVFDGNVRFWYKDGEIPVHYELFWDGAGQQPDFADGDYWIDKAKELGFQGGKRGLVEDGLVQPEFTPEELQVLEALERQDGHFFAEMARHRKEHPPVQQTPESQAAANRLLEAKVIVHALLCRLWESYGLAGKWALHTYDLYTPDYDIRDRHTDEDDPQRHTVLRGTEGLYYYGDSGRPLPDFDSMAYWEGKKAELETKIKDIVAGKVKHGFGPGELRRILLLEKEQDDALSLGASGPQKTDSINAWLSGASEAEPPPPPPPLRRSRSPSTGSLDRAQRDPPLRGAGSTSSRQGEADSSDRKRKRPANNDEGLPSGHGPKRSREQPPPESSTTNQHYVAKRALSSPQWIRGHSRTAGTAGAAGIAPSTLRPGPPDSDVWAKLARHLPVKRGSSWYARGEYPAAESQARHPTEAMPGVGRRLKKRGTSPSDAPVRRSARIAALPPRTYLYR